MSQEKEGIERDEHLVHKAYLEGGAAVLCCSALKLEQMTHAHITHVSAGSVKILLDVCPQKNGHRRVPSHSHSQSTFTGCPLSLHSQVVLLATQDSSMEGHKVDGVSCRRGGCHSFFWPNLLPALCT